MAEMCDAVVGGTFGQFRRCRLQAWDGAACPWCRRNAFWCRRDGHEEGALQNLEGHKLLEHPEHMPEAVALVAIDPTRLALAREAAGKFPAQYDKLRAALAGLGVTL